MKAGAYRNHRKAFQVSTSESSEGSQSFNTKHSEFLRKNTTFVVLVVIVTIQFIFWLLGPSIIPFTQSELKTPQQKHSLPFRSPLVHLGIHTAPERILNRAVIRSLLRQSLPSDFSYEFVFSREGLTGDVAHVIAAEMHTFEDSVIVSEQTPEGWQVESHYKTIRWLQHATLSNPRAKYYVKTDDDTFFVLERLRFLILGIKSTNKFIFFGRDDAMSSSQGFTKKYMVGFLYGLSKALAKKIVANSTGLTLMVEEQGYFEDLQTAHWIHLLQKRSQSFDGKLNSVYSQVQEMNFDPLEVQWIDWSDLIGQPSWIKESEWSKPITNETLAIHGLKTPEQFFFAVQTYCDTFSAINAKSSLICSKTKSFWK